MNSIYIALFHFSILGQSAQSALQFNITPDRPGINLKSSQLPGTSYINAIHYYYYYINDIHKGHTSWHQNQPLCRWQPHLPYHCWWLWHSPTTKYLDTLQQWESINKMEFHSNKYSLLQITNRLHPVNGVFMVSCILFVILLLFPFSVFSFRAP